MTHHGEIAGPVGGGVLGWHGLDAGQSGIVELLQDGLLDEQPGYGHVCTTFDMVVDIFWIPTSGEP